MNTCRSCGAAIRWVEMVTGSKMPLDAEPPRYGGNILVASDGKGEVVNGEARKICQEEGQRLYRSHFATCPAAQGHRKLRKKA